MNEIVFLENSAQNILNEIEKIVAKFGIDYIDAAVHYSEESGIDIESLITLVKKNVNFKAKIQFAAEQRNLLPKSARLPL